MMMIFDKDMNPLSKPMSIEELGKYLKFEKEIAKTDVSQLRFFDVGEEYGNPNWTDNSFGLKQIKYCK